jgi:hypothetical protein
MSSQIPLYDVYTKVVFMQLVFHNIYLYKKLISVKIHYIIYTDNALYATSIW